MAFAGTPWQLDCEKLEQRCGYLLTSGLWSDCIFMVGSGTNQEAVPGHKLVLAMASPVFEAMFYGALSEGNDPIVPIPDVEPEAFRALLEYMYTGNLKIGSFNMAWNIMYGAKKYMLPQLVKECNTYICSALAPKNACQAYEYALFFDEKNLKDKCIKMISTNTKAVLKDSSFMDVELKTLITVCSLEHLNLDSEIDLFNAVARYAEVERTRQGQISPPVEEGASKELSQKLLLSIDSPQNSPAAELDSKPPADVVTSEPTADREKNKEDEPSIRDAIKKLRFLSMSSQEFAEGPARSDLLTKDESYAVIMNIASTDNVVPMPTGFTECRQRRQPSSDSKEQCVNVVSLESTLNYFNQNSFESGARAAADNLRISHRIQPALDKGILDGLQRVFIFGNAKEKLNAALAISALCAHGSPSQLGVLAASDVLEPYCNLLTAEDATCYSVLLGLTDLLQNIEQNNEPDLLLKLRGIYVPKLLINVHVQKDRSAWTRQQASQLLGKYFL